MPLPPRRLLEAIVVASLWPSALAAAAARVDSYDIGSLASPFLQSETRTSVLDRDDKADAACQEKLFTKADPVRAPDVRVSGAITERRWREIWTLARCGTDVYYMIFFTEEGGGGASYAIVGPGTFEEVEKYKDAQPAAAPPSQDFVVYFDSNKFNVRADTARTLEAVVLAAKQLANPQVVLTGHTDTVGSSAYNQKLSDERALAVKAYLVHHGIAVANITTAGVGKNDLRVATPDQVGQQENRNVHIEVK